MVDTVGDALPREIARVRDVVIPQYRAIGPVGTFGLTMLHAALDRAIKATDDGDVVAMIRSFEELKGCE